MSAHKDSESPDEFPLQNLGCTLEEDEYGYVEPRERKISELLIKQLPSRNINFVIPEEEREDATFANTLRRRNSRYQTAQLKTATLRSQSVNTDVTKIYEILSSDPDATEEDKVKTLRDMKQSLTIKRMVKEKLDAENRRKRADQVLDGLTRFKLQIFMALYQFLHKMKNLSHSIELWHSPIKAIQGQFGSGVASYFLFLRWLLYINICTFIITLCFVVIPQFIYQQSKNVQQTQFNASEYSFSPYDLLTGSGWFTDSLFYFGHYTHEEINVVPGLYYSMPLSYLFTLGVNFLFTLVAISYSLTTCYRKSYVGLAGEMKNIFCNKILCAWDYSIETEEAAKLRRKAFCTEIKELLYMTRGKSKDKTLAQNVVRIVSTVLIHIFVLAVISAVGYVIYFLLDQKTLKIGIRIFDDMTLSLTATFISTSCFFFLKLATKFELHMSKKMKWYLTTIRVTLLRIVMLGVIVYVWTIIANPERGMNICYETELGKEIYRLILINFLMSVIFLTFIGEFIRKLICVFVFPSVQLSQFDIAYNTLDLIYYQTLAWLGAVFIPVASLMIIVILIFLFYIKLKSITFNCRPHRKSWSVNEAHLIFLALTFFMFLLSYFSVGYILFALTPSMCGPFSEYENTGDLIQNMFFKIGEEHNASEFIKYITSPGVLFSLFCALCVGVYYMRAQANAHISVVKRVREQLLMEGKDKAFLLQLYEDALKIHLKLTSKNNDLASNEEISSPSNDAHEVLINQAYKDYSDQATEIPLPKNFGLGYIPANVPVNKPSCSGEMNIREASSKNTTPKLDPNLRLAAAYPKERNSPLSRLKGIPYRAHPPPFGHLFHKEASP